MGVNDAISFNSGYNPRNAEQIAKYAAGLTSSASSGANQALPWVAAAGGATLGKIISPQQFADLARFGLGMELCAKKENPFEGMGMMLGIGAGLEGFKGIGWLNRAYKNQLPENFFNGLSKEEIAYAKKHMVNPLFNGQGGWYKAEGYKAAGQNISKAWGEFMSKTRGEMDAFTKAGGWTSKGKYVEVALNNHRAHTITEHIPQGEKLNNLSKKTQNLYTKAQKLAEKAKTGGANSKALFKEANSCLAQARALAYAENAKVAKGFWAKAGKVTGVTKVNGWLKNWGAKNSKVASFLKHGKGNGLFLAMEGGMALFSDIIPSFTQLGAGKGTKQLFKSSVKVGASIGGWTAGMAAGSALGTLICPGLGTVVGGVVGTLVGMIGGTLGAWAAGKVVDKGLDMTGLDHRSEVEIAKEKQADELAANAMNDKNVKAELVAMAAQRLQAEGAETEDAKKVMESLNQIAGTVETEAVENQTAPQDNTSFKGNTGKIYSEKEIQEMLKNQYKQNPFANSMDADFMAMNAGLI